MPILNYFCTNIFHQTFPFTQCDGPSMLPVINDNNILLTEKITSRLKCVPKGSIVIVRSPSDPHKFICKRLVGLPGDRVKLDNSSQKAYANVPKGHMWLEGDNKNNSLDSRSYGPVPYGLLNARAVAVLWPIVDVGILKSSLEKT